MFCRKVWLHRLIFAAQREPAPFRHRKPDERFGDRWIVGRKEDFCFCLIQPIVRLAKLPQQQRHSGTHLHVSKQCRAKQCRLGTDGRPTDGLWMLRQDVCQVRPVQRDSQRMLDTRDTAAQMAAGFRHQRIVPLPPFIGKEEGQINGMTNGNGGHACHDRSRRPTVRRSRSSEERKGAHDGQHSCTSLKCTKPYGRNKFRQFCAG